MAAISPSPPADWRYYAEKLRKARCDIDAAEIAPYLALDNMIAAAFDTAQRLFGLSFHERHDVPAWHPTTCGSGRSGPPAASSKGYFSATISPAPPSAAAPG